MRIAELARRAGIAPSAVRWYERVGVLPEPARSGNGYRAYGDVDLARLRLLVSLRRLGLGPEEAGRLARLCLERVVLDADLAPLLAEQRASIARRRADLDRLEGELLDLELTVAAAGRATRRVSPMPQAAPIRVLFLCTHNSARSQIAEALLTRYGGDDFVVRSAGTEETRVNPDAVRVLAELGIDWSGAESKTLERFLGEPWDYVVTVCDRARQACPVFPGTTNSLHWGLDDPSAVEGTDEVRLAAFRATAQELAVRLRPFIEVALRAAGRPARRAGTADR